MCHNDCDRGWAGFCSAHPSHPFEVIMRSEKEIKEKIAQLQGILEAVDEPRFVVYLTTMRRCLEWVLE